MLFWNKSTFKLAFEKKVLKKRNTARPRARKSPEAKNVDKRLWTKNKHSVQ